MSLIITFINTIVTVITLMVVMYTLLRLFLDPYHPILNVLGKVIEPILASIRKQVPPIGGFDFSPLILIIGLQVLAFVLIALLRSLV